MNRKTLYFFITLLLISCFSLFAGGKKENVEIVSTPISIGPERLYDIIENKEEFLLLDLRRSDDYKIAHIDGAVNADMDSAVQNDDYETSAKVLKNVLKSETGNKRGEGTKLVLICYTGNRYARAALSILSDMKRDLSDVYIVEGGYKAWNEFNNKKEVPEEKETTTTTSTTSSSSYAWNDVFIFARRRG